MPSRYSVSPHFFFSDGPKPEREDVHADADPLARQEMAEFVDEDQDAEADRGFDNPFRRAEDIRGQFELSEKKGEPRMTRRFPSIEGGHG